MVMADEIPDGKELHLSERVGVVLDGNDVVLMNKVSGLGFLLTKDEAQEFTKQMAGEL